MPDHISRYVTTAMTPAAITYRTIPTELLADLRAARHGDPDELDAFLNSWDLQPLTGGRNNDVFAWDGICIKLYRKTGRNRVEREWHGLAHVAALGVTPLPLWRDDHPDKPAIGMTLVPGTPAHKFPVNALTGLVRATRAMQHLPLAGPLTALPRVDSIEHHIARLTDVWPSQLAENPHDDHTREMVVLLRRWNASADTDLLARPAPLMFSRGDANLLNWHHHDGDLHVVDFEYSGHSDAADHIEHISANHIPEHAWLALIDELGVDRRNRDRFDAARRTIALRWLAVLWKQRHHRTDEFLRQLDRVNDLSR